MAEKVANHMTLTFPSDREIAVTRTFDAPRSLVFEAFVRCEHLSKWWGPRGFTLVECEIDLRPGGAYRFVQTAPDGGVHPFKGVWREINPPERLVFTQIYDVERYSIHESVVINVLTEQDGRTTLAQHLQFSSKEARDWMVASGMELGMTQSLERLDELLVELRGSAGSEAEAIVELVNHPRIRRTPRPRLEGLDRARPTTLMSSWASRELPAQPTRLSGTRPGSSATDGAPAELSPASTAHLRVTGRRRARTALTVTKAA